MSRRTGKRVRNRATTSAPSRGTTRPRSTSTCGSTPTRARTRPRPSSSTRYTAALGDVGWHRYPDRAAHDLRDALGAFLGQPPERLLCANGSNEVLQTLLLTYGGSGRRALLFEPTYALHAQIAADHRHRDRRPASAPPASRSTPSRGATLMRGAEPVDRVRVQPEQPDRHGRSHARPSSSCSPIAAETGSLLIVDEAYGEFAPWSAIELVADEQPLVVVRTYSKVWSLAAVRLGFAVAPAWVIAELEKVLLPYTLSVPTQVAGTVALEFRSEMEQRVAALVEERGRLFAALSEIARPRGGAVGRQLPARAGGGRRARLVATAARPGRARARLLVLAARGRVPARHRRHAGGERRVPGRARRGSRGGGSVSGSQAAGGADSGRPRRPRSIVALDVDGSGTCRVATGIPFFDHMLEQLGKHAGFDLRVDAQGDLEVDLHHTVEDVGIVLGQALREALGEKRGRAALRQRAGSARRGTGPGRARPLGPAVPRVRRRPGRRNGSARSTRSSPRSSGRDSSTGRASRCTSGAFRGRTATTSSRRRSKASRAALRDAVRVEGDDVPSTKGTLTS